MGTFSERLREARKEAGLSQKELAEKGGLSQTTISDIERGRNAGSTEAPLLAEILKVEALWLTDGRGQKSRSQTIQKQPVEPGDNRLPIRRAKFKLSAGVCGYEVEYENGESEPIYMGKRWFEQKHFNPEKLVALKVSGRSMEPKYHDGDLVIVNMASATPKDGVPFAVNYEGEMVIKRMRRDAGQWFISSDNPDKTRYADKLCSEGCYILGEVIYLQTENSL